MLAYICRLLFENIARLVLSSVVVTLDPDPLPGLKLLPPTTVRSYSV